MNETAREEQGDCPNPHGMTVEFAQEIIETRAWRIKGVGTYGSDVDVIALDEYRELAHLQATTMETLARWADSAIAYEKALREIAADEVIPEDVTLSEWAQRALDARKKAMA